MSNNPFITKEGIEVVVGQVWEDLDTRCLGRKVIVKELGTAEHIGKVRITSFQNGQEFGPVRWLSVRRMHRHSTGFKIVNKERE